MFHVKAKTINKKNKFALSTVEVTAFFSFPSPFWTDLQDKRQRTL